MNYGKKRDITESMWSVFTSFGFYENEEENSGKYCVFKNNSVKCVSACDTVKARAEAAAVCIEASLVNGMENLKVTVGNDEIYDLLLLFGFEEIIEEDSAEKSFSAVCGDVKFAEGNFADGSSEMILDIEKFMEALENEGVDMSADDVAASLIFAEEDAEGIAYDIAYSLRVNGCIVEYFNDDADISAAEEYAKKNKMSCILRVYPDGRLLMKDLVKNEITETTAQEFLGYYEEDEDCGCGHEHHHDCDCGCH